MGKVGNKVLEERSTPNVERYTDIDPRASRWAHSPSSARNEAEAKIS